MGWLRKDDRYHDHAKVDALSDAAARLWDMCGCWCRKKENYARPGFVPRSEIMFITKRRWSEDRTLELAQELVDSNPGNRFTAGLWEVCDQGWIFHDWRYYQPIDDEQPLSLTERARTAGKASAAKRLARYGTAQPLRKIDEVSNVRTSSTSSPNRFGDGTDVASVGMQLPLIAGGVSRTKPELSKKNNLVRSQVRAEKSADSSEPTELNELVHRTKPRTCRTSHLPLRDLKTLSKEPDRDRRPPDSDGESEIASPPVTVSVNKPKAISSCQRCEDSFGRVQPEVVALFEAWRDEAKKPNAELTWRRREGFEQLVKSGVTVEIVQRVVRGAKTDLEWAVGKHRLDPTAILFTPEQREKYLDIEAEIRTKTKRTGPQLLKPEPKPDPSTLVSAEQMQETLAGLALGKTRRSPAKPKNLVKISDEPDPVDPARIERIDRAREKAKQSLADFDRDHKSEPPPPITLEA